MLNLTRKLRAMQLLAFGARALRLIRSASGNSKKAKSNRGEFYRMAWSSAARQLELGIRELTDEIFEVQGASRSTVVYRSYTELDSPVVLRLAGNKPLVHRLLNDAGLPVPRHQSFDMSSMDRAVRFVEATRTGCVVKPSRDTAAGAGVSTRVCSRRQLFKAAVAAAAHGNQLIVEQQVAGDNFRLLFLDGVLVDAIRRRPPTVIGDGKSTIAKLVRRENAHRLNQAATFGEPQITIDSDMKRTLRSTKRSLRSVVPSGQAVALKTVINQNGANDNETVSDWLCDDVIDAGRAAAQVLGVRLAGVDIVTPDPSQSLESAGGVILEVNTTPGFHFHYHKRDGCCEVAEHVLRKLFVEVDSGPARQLTRNPK